MRRNSGKELIPRSLFFSLIAEGDKEKGIKVKWEMKTFSPQFLRANALIYQFSFECVEVM